MTVAEAAHLLNLSVASVYELCARELIDHYRLGIGTRGGRIDITAEAVAKYRESRFVPAKGTTPAPVVVPSTPRKTPRKPAAMDWMAEAARLLKDHPKII